MMNLKPSSNLNHRFSSLIEHNSDRSKSLSNDAASSLSRAATVVDESVLNASSRCELGTYYIQAVITGRTAFLTTNLLDVDSTHVTETGNNWLIGRSTTCPVAVQHNSVSRHHAVIGFCPSRGFYITDIGSSNGTHVNRRRLTALEQRFLSDGDLIELGRLRVEFFTSGWTLSERSSHMAALQETLV
jgi:hypothetical protein